MRLKATLHLMQPIWIEPGPNTPTKNCDHALFFFFLKLVIQLSPVLKILNEIKGQIKYESVIRQNIDT